MILRRTYPLIDATPEVEDAVRFLGGEPGGMVCLVGGRRVEATVSVSGEGTVLELEGEEEAVTELLRAVELRIVHQVSEGI